ncbi:hypothetical protein [Pseudoduganella danionis]|uniref:hypothetical protein n=1 Tax=Pseudoduganella danionis TaxID=1890295 RepID=UPI0035B48021
MTAESIGPQTWEREPRKGKKPSSAASNVAQVKAKMEQDGKVGVIALTRAELGVDPKSGESILTAIFPRGGGREPHHVDISFLLGFPNLQQMFTEAFLSWGADLSPSSRRNCRDHLRRYFFAYLKSDWSNLLHPDAIDDELLAGLRDRLVSKPGGSGKALRPGTIGNALSALRSVLESLTVGPWASAAHHIAELVPSGPAGASRKTMPTEVLGMEQLLAIIGAAEREVFAIEQHFAKARVLLAEGHTRLHDPIWHTHNSHADYRNLSVCLSAVDEIWPGVIPNLQVIQTRDPDIGSAVQNTHGHREISSYFYPSGRDMVPFVLLLAITTVFNPDTLLSLNWQDIDLDKDQAGTSAIEIVGAKGRAAQDLVRVLDPNAAVSSRLSLKQMLVCLREITVRIRPYLRSEHADRLFVFVQQSRKKWPKSFGMDGESICLPSNDFVWKIAFNNFIKDNKLPLFTLSQLRSSILDLVQFMDGSLETASKVGNHGNPATTWTHYTSGGVRARYRERIGQVIVLRERWLQTGGVIDPRRLVPGQDKGAATPGFSCLDPFDSPRPNQPAGRLCKDYGACPSCPMAAAHAGDPLCVAYYTALEAAIYRSQGAMSARTWIERWTPVLADLAALRALISPDVLDASREISIRLPNVG